MDKRSKEVLRRYKKSRQQVPSSSDSSSSDSDSSGSSSYSSSDSDRHRKKKARQATGASARHSSSSSAEERRKREKREHCQKKLEAKRNHLKRKLKEAKLKKRAAAAAAALSGHSHRALSPATQAKLKKLAERRHQRAASKERREREKHRIAGREREREHHRGVSRSPTKITKIRIHQDVKRQKSPPRVHHQLMSREKIIIQTRTRDRTPSVERERQRHEHKLRHDEINRERERRERERERAEREAARDKERAEALARCQERQRERERLAREKIRREDEEKKYGSVERNDRLLPRPAEREIAIAAARGYNSRERSLEAVDRTRHIGKRDIVDIYDRERDYLEAERRGIIDRDDIRREREYLTNRRRDLSPVGEHYPGRMRDPRELYPEEERERVYNRTYVEEARHPRDREAWIDPREVRERELHDIRDPRDFREMEHELIYPDERERIVRNRERALATREDWKNDWEINREREWDTTASMGRGGFVGGPKRGGVSGTNISGPPKIPLREHRAPSEPDWDADEVPKSGSTAGSKSESSNIHDVTGFGSNVGQRDGWIEHDQHDLAPQREKPMSSARPETSERRWQNDWREGEEIGVQRIGGNAPIQLHHHRSERGARGFRRGGIGGIDHSERNPQGFRQHPPPLMTLPVQPPQAGYHGVNPRFPNKRNMTYTNPNLIKKQQAALAAAKAAAQASAVAAASTAVAAVKAAALSAANATTNPSILGQVSAVSRLQQSLLSTGEKPGEIVSANEKSITKPEVELNAETTDTITTVISSAVDEKAGGELSEISDSDDEILNKADKKSKAETDEATEDSIGKANTIAEKNDAIVVNEDVATSEDKVDDIEMLDFEEISDGELEEDARNKGVGDALGVDWASLIAETKLQAENTIPNVSEQPTTAKQKWQPHRVILDIGISMRMAGEEYAKQLLSEAKQKLNKELGQIHIKSEVKEETISTTDEDSQMVMDTDENTNDIDEKNMKSKTPQKSLEELNETTINVERLHPIACIQVAERLRSLERRRLIANACGMNSRALSARQDLKLRRQLCGLPARECDFPRPLPAASEKIKAMALAAFQRTLEVK